jgi:hypothetical protein
VEDGGIDGDVLAPVPRAARRRREIRPIVRERSREVRDHHGANVKSFAREVACREEVSTGSI